MERENLICLIFLVQKTAGLYNDSYVCGCFVFDPLKKEP